MPRPAFPMDARFHNLWLIEECPLLSMSDRAYLLRLARRVCERTGVKACVQQLHGRLSLFFYVREPDHGISMPERYTIFVDRAGERRMRLHEHEDSICASINLIRRPRAIEARMMRWAELEYKNMERQEAGRRFDGIRRDVDRTIDRVVHNRGRKIYSFAGG